VETSQSFKDWYAERKSMFDMEHQIHREKLDQGINGLEWLVLQVMLTPQRKESLKRWLEFLREFGQTDFDAVMRDVITMKPNSFYRKYQFNWWISFNDTMTYLCLLKNLNYDQYIKFINSIVWRRKK